jgi:hypothetical protein
MFGIMLIHSQSKEVLCQADTVRKGHHLHQQEKDGQVYRLVKL